MMKNHTGKFVLVYVVNRQSESRDVTQCVSTLIQDIKITKAKYINLFQIIPILTKQFTYNYV